jgi:hypothetical protein
VKADKWYNMLVAVNGTNVTLLVDNKLVFTHTYQPRVVDGYVFGLNNGYVGVGSDQSRGNFDNIRVQILPPQITFDETETFGDGVADLFTAGNTGVWGVSGQRYNVDASASGAVSLLDLGPDHLNHSSYLEMSAKIRIEDRQGPDGRAGFVFDRYGTDSFKYVAIDADADRLIIGHYTKEGGWVQDAFMSTAINTGQDYALGITLKGTTVSATLNNAANGGFQAMVSHGFNASNVDGNFGLMAQSGAASFDDVRVKTNDPALEETRGSNMVASEAAVMIDSTSMLTQSELDNVTVSAMTDWIDRLGDGDPRLAGFGDVRLSVADLGGLALGYTEGRHVWIDSNAAGYGWSMRGVESGRMDLSTVVTHELGNLIGISDNDLRFSVMDEDLEPGVRYLLDAVGFDADPSQPIGNDTLWQLAKRLTDWEAERAGATGTPSFDLGGQGRGVAGGIDWQAGATEGWSGYSPFNATKAMKSAAANFSDYLMKLASKGGSAGDGSAGYDGLGKSLFGSKGKGGR